MGHGRDGQLCKMVLHGRRAFILRTSCYAGRQTQFDLAAKNCCFDSRRSHDQDHNPPFQFNWCGIKCDGREAGFDTLGKSKTAHHACMLFRLKVKVLRSEKVGFGFPNRLLAKESLINVLKPESGGIGSMMMIMPNSPKEQGLSR